MSLLAACGRTPGNEDGIAPELRNAADSLAYRMVEAFGGLDRWSKVRYLRFDFGIDAAGSSRVIARHLWDRFTGDYRVEWSRGPDTTITVLMDVNDRTGAAFVNDSAVSPDKNGALVDAAYERFINDTYWLMVPLKVFDDGVVREVAADSSTADTEVLALSFVDVGLTPGDRYWLFIDRTDGRVRKWSYILQGREDRPASTDNWTDYRSIETPAGTVRVSERRERPRGRAMLMNHVSLPTQVPADVFENPKRHLE